MNENMLNEDWDNINLDYEGENKFASFFSSKGNIHSYPAKAVPEMVRDLIDKLKDSYNIESVLDPFVGSGTTALEAKYLGLDFYGSDLNPLAVLLARTKILTIDNTIYVKRHLDEFVQVIKKKYEDDIFVSLYSFDNIEYWFKEENIKELSFIKNEIDRFLLRSKKNRETYALILLTSFSSTIRSVSLTRNGEFKLYRMSKNDIKKHKVNALDIFEKKISNLLNMLVVANDSYCKDTTAEIYLGNAKKLNYINNKKVQLIITSPPYGDSQSTVAYGQFSRLSVQWMKDLLKKYLNINCDYDNCDQHLLGGKKSDFILDDELDFYNSVELQKLIRDMDDVINKNIQERIKIKAEIEQIIQYLNQDNTKEIDFKISEMVLKLIKERIRLDLYRYLNSKKKDMDSKKIKEIARTKSEQFINELFSINEKLRNKRKNQLKSKLPYIKDTIDRNINSMPKRKVEVIDFFKDLYKVTIESNRVLDADGIQAWIVGHRTVLGEVNVNMNGILKDWFSNMGYKIVTSLERKYSFKRMPHHINSTINKEKKVNTMMNEYILIVQKQ